MLVLESAGWGEWAEFEGACACAHVEPTNIQFLVTGICRDGWIDWIVEKREQEREGGQEARSKKEACTTDMVWVNMSSRWLILCGAFLPSIEAFYMPGVTPHTYNEGEVVKVRVNKLTSSKTMLPYDFYRYAIAKQRTKTKSKTTPPFVANYF